MRYVTCEVRTQQTLQLCHFGFLFFPQVTFSGWSKLGHLPNIPKVLWEHPWGKDPKSSSQPAHLSNYVCTILELTLPAH